jgi:hypothetical protein
MQKIIERKIGCLVEEEIKDLDTLLYVSGNFTAILAAGMLLAAFFCELTDYEKISEYNNSIYVLGLIMLAYSEYFKFFSDKIGEVRSEISDGVLNIDKIRDVIGSDKLNKISKEVRDKYSRIVIPIE